MLTLDGCARRLDRVRSILADRELDLLLLTDPCHVYYVTGCLPPWFALGAVAIGAERSVLATSEPRSDGSTVDDVRVAEAQSNATIRLDQADGIAALLAPELAGARRVGLDQGVLGAAALQRMDATFADVTPDLLHLRRRKDPDEVELIQAAARCIDAAYARAAQVIEPGLDELALYSELSAAVVEEAGELPLRFGQDFQCGSPGGPPRRRPARAEELWILDLGVNYRGYYADASRVFAVTAPTDEQERAHRQAVDTLAEDQADGAAGRGLRRPVQPGARAHGPKSCPAACSTTSATASASARTSRPTSTRRGRTASWPRGGQYHHRGARRVRRRAARRGAGGGRHAGDRRRRADAHPRAEGPSGRWSATADGRPER